MRAVEISARRQMTKRNRKKIWIDLDNSPHVPLFVPIIGELEKSGYSVMITVRDNAQTCELAELFKLNYKKVGHSYGKHLFLKSAGLFIRSMELVPEVMRQKPDFALSHGARSQHLLALALRIPLIMMMDYEYVRMLPFANTSRIIMPEAIPVASINMNPDHIIRYPGIKEDVYVPSFQPDGTVMEQLGLDLQDIILTVRPPATEAHYHNPESETIFDGTIDFLMRIPEVRIVMLPRNNRQMAVIKERWSQWCTGRRIVIPECVVDGLNLLWHSDLAISGGGTMNREAAALGVPVYSIFRGKTGAVDQYLSNTGRLTLICGPDEVQKKIAVARRYRPERPEHVNHMVLKTIVDGIMEFVETN